MDEITEQADEDLAGVPVPASMSEIARELRASIDLFRRAARLDLRGRETDDAALLEQAAALTEQGSAGFEQIVAMLQDLIR